MSIFFFFNDTATTEIYTLSLHDALPISFGERLILDVDIVEDLDVITDEADRHEQHALTSYPGQVGNDFASIWTRSEEHTSELQSRPHLVCRLLLEKKKRSS